MTLEKLKSDIAALGFKMSTKTLSSLLTMVKPWEGKQDIETLGE